MSLKRLWVLLCLSASGKDLSLSFPKNVPFIPFPPPHPSHTSLPWPPAFLLLLCFCCLYSEIHPYESFVTGFLDSVFSSSAQKVKGTFLAKAELSLKGKDLRGPRWVCILSRVLLFCDPVDCSPPGSSVHGILQARTLEWVAISFSRGSSWPRDQTPISWQASSLPLGHLGNPRIDYQQESAYFSAYVVIRLEILEITSSWKGSPILIHTELEEDSTFQASLYIS